MHFTSPDDPPVAAGPLTALVGARIRYCSPVAWNVDARVVPDLRHMVESVIIWMHNTCQLITADNYRRALLNTDFHFSLGMALPERIVNLHVGPNELNRHDHYTRLLNRSDWLGIDVEDNNKREGSTAETGLRKIKYRL